MREGNRLDEPLTAMRQALYHGNNFAVVHVIIPFPCVGSALCMDKAELLFNMVVSNLSLKLKNKKSK